MLSINILLEVLHHKVDELYHIIYEDGIKSNATG